MRILWYISSHGWGHAARQRELIRVFKEKYPSSSIAVASDVPEWFWNGSEIDSVVSGSPSPIVLEKNGDIDLEATRAHFLKFISQSDRHWAVEREKQLLLNPDIIVSDIDPLPIHAAEINKIPAFAISNFTWDWIMKELFPELANETMLISKMYEHATYLKLPMGPDYSPCHKTLELPLLRGGPPGNQEKAKNLLPSGKICLVALREIPAAMTLSVPEDFTALSSLPDQIHPICTNISPEELASEGATFADLVAACDVLVSKPGYGIISQILTMGKNAVLLTGRKFPEERHLLIPLQDKPGIKLTPLNSGASLDSLIGNLSHHQGSCSTELYQGDTIADLLYSII